MNIALAALLAALAIPAPTTSPSLPIKNTEKPFVVYNSLHYRETPDLTSDGLHQIQLIYEDKLTSSPALGIGPRSFNESLISNASLSSKASPNTPVSLDIESWGLGDDAMEKYTKSIKTFKSHSSTKVGLYGFFPANTRYLYDAISSNDTEKQRRWREKLQRRAIKVSNAVDIYMPSFYTWGKDFNAWEKTVIESTSLARSTDPNKPIYAFVWPQYYDNKTPYALEFIDPKTWRRELEVLYKYTDGIIIWSSHKDSKGHPIKFSKEMPWFIETKNFIQLHKIR